MTENKKQVTASDEHEPDSPISREMAEALAELVFPLDDQVDLESAAEALTDEDRKALAALGNSLELVARITQAA